MLFFVYSTTWVVVLMCFLFQFQAIHSIHDDRKQNNTTVTGFSLRMIHRNSPKSPVYQPELTDEERMKRLVQMSHTRVQSLFTRRNTNTSFLSLNAQVVRPPIYTQHHVYHVEIGIGRFDGPISHYTYFLHLDTGGDASWTQCEGCTLCFPQRDPYFPRSRSRTYKPFPCNECPPNTRCEQGHCTFSTSYADGSYVKGIWARETFSFKSNNDQVVIIPNLIFACGIEMHDFVESNIPNNIVSGVLSLGNCPWSFASQLKPRKLNKFSYCLRHPTTQHDSGPMYLRCGEDIIRSHGMVSTPILRVANQNYYYLNLLGISVANQRLNIPSNVFRVKKDNSGGTVIDSGSTLSYIHPYAYTILVSAIEAYIRDNNRYLLKNLPEAPFKECWDRMRDPPQVNLPSVTFHFENADFVVQPDSVFYKTKTRFSMLDMYCLAIFQHEAEFQTTILGGYQQANQRIIYELDVPQLTFAPVDCLHDN